MSDPARAVGLQNWPPNRSSPVKVWRPLLPRLAEFQNVKKCGPFYHGMFFDICRERVSLGQDLGSMSDVAYLRDEAQRCRDLAVSALDSELAKRWHQLADRYAVLAEQRAASETGRAPLLRMPVEEQPVQQQQPKTQPK